MRRRYKYAFTKKGETEGGFASAIFAGISLFLFLVSQCAGGYGKWSFVRGLAGPFSDRSVEKWKNV